VKTTAIGPANMERPAQRAAFSPRADDIYIVSYPRSGTSWLQMILYQLTTDGDMDFEHISRVIPFLEQSLRQGDSLDQLPSPRILKTHLPYKYVSRWSGKYIYIARDGRDVLVSYYQFYRNYFAPETSFGSFFHDYLAGRVLYGSWFQHVAGWDAHRDDPNVLFLRYEELAESLEAIVERIAAFCGRSLSAVQRARILERSRFEFMRRHEKKFAPEPGSDGLAVQTVQSGAFIRSGRAGTWREQLTTEQEAAFEEACRRHLCNADGTQIQD
jgi:Sulfotransferase domain